MAINSCHRSSIRSKQPRATWHRVINQQIELVVGFADKEKLQVVLVPYPAGGSLPFA